MALNGTATATMAVSITTPAFAVALAIPSTHVPASLLTQNAPPRPRLSSYLTGSI